MKDMTMAFASETHGFSTTLVQRLNAYRAQLIEAAQRRKIYRTTVAELSALSSRDLADLGLGRTDIRRVAYEAAYGKNI